MWMFQPFARHFFLTKHIFTSKKNYNISSNSWVLPHVNPSAHNDAHVCGLWSGKDSRYPLTTHKAMKWKLLHKTQISNHTEHLACSPSHLKLYLNSLHFFPHVI